MTWMFRHQTRTLISNLLFWCVSIGNNRSFGNLHNNFHWNSWSHPQPNYVRGWVNKNHCDLYKGHIHPQNLWFGPDRNQLGSNPSLNTTQLTSLEFQLGFPTSKKQNLKNQITTTPYHLQTSPRISTKRDNSCSFFTILCHLFWCQ